MRRTTTPTTRSTTRTPLRAAAAAVFAAALLAAQPLPASADGNARGGKDLYAASSAAPGPGHPVATDTAVAWSALRPNGTRAFASATAESSCAHCSGQATTLQVLTAVGMPAIAADNAATAYTTGDWASSSAVSAQIVVAALARSITANNRAVAVNEGCTGCRASSVAFQFILVGVKQRDVSAAARAVVLQIEQALALTLDADAALPSAARYASAQAAGHDAAERARAVIAADTGTDVETKVDVDTGD